MSEKWFEYDKKTNEILGFSNNVELEHMITISNAWNSAVKRKILKHIKGFQSVHKRRPILSDLVERTNMSKANLSINLKELRLRRIILFHEKTTPKGKTKEIELLIEPIEKSRTLGERAKNSWSKDVQDFKKGFAEFKRDLGIKGLEERDVLKFLKEQGEPVPIKVLRDALGPEVDKALRHLQKLDLVSIEIRITKTARTRVRNVYYSLT